MSGFRNYLPPSKPPPRPPAKPDCKKPDAARAESLAEVMEKRYRAAPGIQSSEATLDVDKVFAMLVSRLKQHAPDQQQISERRGLSCASRGDVHRKGSRAKRLIQIGFRSLANLWRKLTRQVKAV